jgi:nuclear pore complex protein Nup133
MSAVNPLATEDVIRLFFRSQVNNLDKLLDLVFSTFRAATNGQPDISDWTIEVNTIFLVSLFGTVFGRIILCQRALRESTRLREDEQSLYEIDRERPATELWTSQDSFLLTMEYLFFATGQLIQDRTRDLGTVIDEKPTEGGDDRLHREQVKQERLKDQMTNIGASLCINMEDRVRFAST